MFEENADIPIVFSLFLCITYVTYPLTCLLNCCCLAAVFTWWTWTVSASRVVIKTSRLSVEGFLALLHIYSTFTMGKNNVFLKYLYTPDGGLRCPWIKGQFCCSKQMGQKVKMNVCCIHNQVTTKSLFRLSQNDQCVFSNGEKTLAELEQNRLGGNVRYTRKGRHSYRSTGTWHGVHAKHNYHPLRHKDSAIRMRQCLCF